MKRSIFSLLLAAVACSTNPPPAQVTPPPAQQPAPAPPKTAPAPARSEPSPATPAGARAPVPERLAGGGPRSVSGTKGVVTSAEENATKAGIEVLKAGGNAADAAVAVAATLAVTHPNAGNLGGGGFALVRARGGPTAAFDFRESAPRSLTRPDFDAMIRAGAFGPGSIGVPGTPAGLVALHAAYGKLPFARVLARAVALARDGHALGQRQASLLARAWPVMKNDRAARAVFGRKDKPLAAGTHFRQPELAATLERLARDGAAGFYTGDVARALGTASGGRITDADLAGYRSERRAVLEFRYRGFDVQTMPPPSAGGPTFAGTLLALEHLSPNARSTGSLADIHAFLEVSRRAQALRRLTIVDPGPNDGDTERRRLSKLLDPELLLAVPLDREHATASSAIHPLYPAALRETEHTTHLSVIDGGGMVVSLTTTLSASFGSRIVAPGTGVLLNNAVASFSSVGDNQPAAGRRTTSSMSPTLVLAAGDTVLVLGTPGGDTIPSTIASLVVHLIDHKKTLDDAVDAPRLHHGFVPDAVRYETRYLPPKAILTGLAKLGHVLKPSPIVQGDANCILVDGERAYGYADPREPGGKALAVP
jgi:gamma-glutamyltranspeptidase/glutathione hydrolase